MDGFWTRLSYAFRCFYWILVDGQIPPDILQHLVKAGTQGAPGSSPGAPTPSVRETPGTGPAKPVPVPTFKESDQAPGESSDRAVQILALLQRDSRLIDFLTEDVSPYPDAQLGAAVRTIHESCRQVLDHYLKLEPIINSVEDQPVTVEAGFDPAAIRLVGKVTGTPPVRGLLAIEDGV